MIFGAVARVRRRLLGGGWLKAERAGRPVVSLGNLMVGGAGKTPHTAFLAERLVAAGLSPAILSRGYGRSTRGVVIVSDGRKVVAGPREAGDEPFLLARRLPSVPVIVGESRAAAAAEFLACGGRADLFLLDDGFQHLSLRRDADLLLVDAKRGVGNGWTIPFGRLREPVSHARFADALLVTKAESAADGERVALAIGFPVGRPVATTRYRVAGFVDPVGRELPSPAGSTVAFAGLADNAGFARTLAEHGVDVDGFLPFRDHHWYTAADVAKISEAARGRSVVTTEKDLVRLPANLPFVVSALRIDVEPLDGWNELFALVTGAVRRGAR